MKSRTVVVNTTINTINLNGIWVYCSKFKNQDLTPLDSQEIIKKLKEGAFKLFKDQISNNCLMDIKWGLENILDKIVEVQE